MDSLFFYVSKFAWALLNPVNLMVILVCVASVCLFINLQKIAKVLFALLLMVNVPILIYPVGDLLIYPLENRFHKPINTLRNIDGIIVLGGGENLAISSGWQSPEMNDAGDRFIYAAKLAEQYPNVPVIYSGGSGLVQLRDDQKSAEISQAILTMTGVEENRLIIESASRNTAQNFTLIKPLLPAQDGYYLLVTSAFHMPRSVGIARKLGINVIAYPVDYRSNIPTFRTWSIDYFSHVSTLTTAWREWIGLIVYFVTDKTSSLFPK
jgi:uncharacterized SAM-binding protein YcdF (DUF218 family)